MSCAQLLDSLVQSDQLLSVGDEQRVPRVDRLALLIKVCLKLGQLVHPDVDLFLQLAECNF